ncbi:murein L,D-transpeptidase family protein [uncultured Campylobacter sp.]|uniref:L,D-transpeptidase family protein n=1 Tax=uncultured Campylobacter sp. TaxID=218934 RepID=UPI0026065431|nr:murein L,D-transpeptidase family protein [uncultured Campylobacter sp.]
MFKKIFFLFLLSFGTSIFASDLARIYLNEGLEAVGRELEKELANKNFWLTELEGKDLSLGYYSERTAIVLTNKTDKTLKVFLYNNGSLNQVFEQSNVLTGLMGDKQKEGDLITPVGFYDLGAKFDPKNTYYGPFAFATDYPNLLDRVNDKTGGGIWIHGYPMDGTRLDEYKTRGCIALHNHILVDFSKIIDKEKNVYAMTENKEAFRTNKEDIASIMASLFAWKDSWTVSDIDRYLSFYDEKDFKRFDKSGFKEFANMKRIIFSRNEDKTIKFSNINISPYPNLANQKMFRITFYQDYQATNHRFRGNKLLYVKLDENGKMKIIAER